MTNLLLHTQRLADLLPLLEATRPEYVKAVNPDGASVRRCNELGIKVLARYTGVWDMGEPSVVLARNFAGYCASQDSFADVWGVETPNEPHPGSAWWMAAAVRALRTKRPDLYVVVGNWGNGWDGFPIPVDLEDEPYTVYGSHEYGEPRHPDLMLSLPGYHALRHQDLGQAPGHGGWFERDVLPVQPWAKLMITEFGLTDVANPDGFKMGLDEGWLKYGVQPEAYWASVQGYLAHLKPYVLGAFWFNWGVYPLWETHEGLGTELEGYYRSYGGPAPSLGQPSAPGSTVEGPMVERTEQQQLIINVVNGAATELAAARMVKKRRLNLAKQLGDVKGWLEAEFPLA